jgi:hypothetical protein
MIEILEHIGTGQGTVPLRKLFVVAEQMRLNETRSPMQPNQTGFAYLPVSDPVQIEIDNIPYTTDRKTFLASTRWCVPA